MNKIFGKSILVLFWIGLVFVSWCGKKTTENVSIDTYEKTYVVRTWFIISNNKYVWTLVSEDNTYLWFKLPWRIVNLFVKEWDYVKKWQLLWVLDWSEVKTQYSSTKEILAALQQMYENTKAMFDAQIKSMEHKVEQAKTAMQWYEKAVKDTQSITKEQLETAKKHVEQAKVWMETAKTNLEHTKTILEQKEKDIYSNSKNALAQAKIVATNFIDFVDRIFGISDKNKHANDAFEVYLSAKNTALKEKIESEWRKVNAEYLSWKKEVDWLIEDIKKSSNITKDEKLKQRVYDMLQKSEKLFVSLRWLADDVYKAIDSSVSSPTFPQTMIDNLKQQTVNFQNMIEKTLLTAEWNFLLGIKGSIQAIDNFRKESKAKLDLLQKQYELAKKQYETAKQTYNQYLAMAQWKKDEVTTKYEVAKKQYEEALKWLQALKKQRDTQLASIMAKIKEVKAHKNLASVNLSNIRLYAPYDGVITKKLADIWQVVWAWTPVFVIANPNKVKGVFYVPVEEVKNIKIWQKVIISWLWEFTTWYISVINPAADLVSKKIQVEVKIKKVPNDWKLWMFITGYPSNDKFYGLLVPQSFIRYEYGKPYVFRRVWKDKYEKVFIKLWKCDNDFCIVEKWLNKWDVIK